MNAKYFIVGAALMGLLSCSNDLTKINLAIENIGKNYAPDQRVAIWDIACTNESGKILISGETNQPDAAEALNSFCNSLKKQIIMNIELLPQKSFGDTIYGVANASVVNFRTKPGHSQELATQTLLGHPLRIYKVEKDWYYIQSSDDYLGWLENSAFTLMTTAQFTEWQKSEKLIFTADNGFSYSRPDENSQRVSDLIPGVLLKYIAAIDNYYHVEYPDGRLAYIARKDAEIYSTWLSSRNPTPENILKTAYRFIGLPYTWGGTSAKTLDCSGFTKTTYFLNGILLSRDASQQVFLGDLVTEDVNDLDTLKPADLLFFGEKAADGKTERITHVGMYIGNGEMIHESGPVLIESLKPGTDNFTQYRYNTFIRAKRIIGSDIKKLNDCRWYQSEMWKQ